MLHFGRKPLVFLQRRFIKREFTSDWMLNALQIVSVSWSRLGVLCLTHRRINYVSRKHTCLWVNGETC